MKKNIFIVFLITLLVFLIVPQSAFAAPPVSCSAVLSAGISNVQTLIKSVGCVIGKAVPVVISLALLFFLWGLAKFILVAGDEKEKERGKNIMIWGIVALFVMVSIWGLVSLLRSNLGITNITPTYTAP